jgi:hypothetical protein
MAKATGTGGCGCGQPVQERVEVLKGKVLGEGWKEIVEEILMKDAADQARAQVKAEKQSAQDDAVVVRIPMTVFVSFPQEDNRIVGDGVVGCVCTTTAAGTCKCIGACVGVFPGCCDPIVAEAYSGASVTANYSSGPAGRNLAGWPANTASYALVRAGRGPRWYTSELPTTY